MYAHTSSDKARFQPKLSAAGFVCLYFITLNLIYQYSIDKREKNRYYIRVCIKEN